MLTCESSQGDAVCASRGKKGQRAVETLRLLYLPRSARASQYSMYVVFSWCYALGLRSITFVVLALQNLQGEEVFGHCDHDQTEMVEGLHGSLTMMEKVLNDVLSFNRMESGRVRLRNSSRPCISVLTTPLPKFTQARKPFDFHKSVQIVILSHRAQALAGNLYLQCELDPEIDRLGGRFMGDEMRLRQVMSNFTSNALKFTTEGGIKVVTKLLFPRMESSAQTPDQEYSEAEKARNDSVVSSEKSAAFNIETPGGTQIQLNQLERGSQRDTQISEKQAFSGHLPNSSKAAQPGQKAIIRVEVHDTGVGLHPKDVKDNKLFSPYTQT